MFSIQKTFRLAAIATTLSTAMMASAFAQTAAPGASPAAPQPVPPVQMETFYSGSLSSTGWRATEAMDEVVHNLQKDRIGEVKDLLIDSDGRVVAAIIGVGGFLGMGERDVAVNYRAIKLSRDDKGKPLFVVDVTKETLKTAPIYKSMRSAKRE
jgi:hypothetical protein